MKPTVRIIEERTTRAVEEPVATGTGSVQPDPASVAADADERDTLDGVAGSEFVDDQIRLEE